MRPSSRSRWGRARRSGTGSCTIVGFPLCRRPEVAPSDTGLERSWAGGSGARFWSWVETTPSSSRHTPI